jgi:C4-dicarboxylate-specific signal transduction histidine kinase
MADLAGLVSPVGWRLPVQRGARAGVFALGLSVLLLFALGLVIAASQVGLRSRFDVIQHTNDVLLQAAAVNQDLQRMESDMRGYGFSGDAGHIAGWSDHAAAIDWRLGRLATLVSDNPEQSARLAAARALIAQWVARWKPYADHPSPSMMAGLRAQLAQDLKTHPGRRIHGALNAFGGVERMLLVQRQVIAARQVTLLQWLSVVLALAAPSLGAAGIFLLFREENRARQRELEQQLQHSQRLALMGETASALAHELNQPLSAARTYLSVARRSEQEKQAEILGKADKEVERAGAILLRLRNFIQKRESEWHNESCASLVADAVALLGTINATVQLHTKLQPGLPLVMVDRIQIQQVLVNLMRNAIEAMAGAKRREMWLSVAMAPDARVIFRLRDSGPGLAPAVVEKLFQPFTTTKPGGMGIGLSICRRILQEHGGTIWAEVPAEGGGCFCFSLPVTN